MNSKNYLSTLLFILFITHSTSGTSQNWNKFAVPLGEKNLNSTITDKANNCKVVTIRIDSDGNLYPDFYITDKSFKKSNSTLEGWYKRYSKSYAKIQAQENLSANSSVENLNEVITNKFVKNIDSLSSGRNIVFLIHGYRKRMYKRKDNTLSTYDNNIVSGHLGKNKLFIEIYWDSRHISKVKGVIGKRGLTMLEASSIPNAIKVGKRLRIIVDKIKERKIYIVCHSLGAIVTNYLTFNYNDSDSFMGNKMLKAVYLAPAIGHNAFISYIERGKAENYNLKSLIAYNWNDWVLKKDFTNLIDSDATTYGNTTLGCDHKGEIQKLADLFAMKMPEEAAPVTVNMESGRNHLFYYYSGHPEFKQVMAFLFND